MLMLDPPDRTRLRALANKAFTLRAVAALESRTRGNLAALLDDIAGPAVFDLVESVAHPYPEQPPVSSTSLDEPPADDF